MSKTHKDGAGQAPSFPTLNWFVRTINNAAESFVKGQGLPGYLAGDIASEVLTSTYQSFLLVTSKCKADGTTPEDEISECIKPFIGAVHKKGLKLVKAVKGKASFAEEKAKEGGRKRSLLPRKKAPAYAKYEMLSVKMNQQGAITAGDDDGKSSFADRSLDMAALELSPTCPAPAPIEAYELVQTLLGELQGCDNEDIRRLVASMYKADNGDVRAAAKRCNIPKSTAQDLMKRFRTKIAPRLEEAHGIRVRRGKKRGRRRS